MTRSSVMDEVRPDSPAGEAIERVRQRKAEERSQERRPLNPDHDLSWENQTSFGDNDYD